MKTSDDVQQLGVYASDCCLAELIFYKNDCFSRCTRCEQRCDWELIEKLIPWTELEEVEVEAA